MNSGNSSITGKALILDEAPAIVIVIAIVILPLEPFRPYALVIVIDIDIPRANSKASEHLPKKCAIDRVVGLLQVDDTQEQRQARFPFQLLQPAHRELIGTCPSSSGAGGTRTSSPVVLIVP